ncbi:MAG: VWA domain-containing protein [Myxococcales bacterium]|nr:VWA domain-containing protein [Myxococcales bacterium]MCB9718328.1 VWA domain-containing protein [Myxococcales bacterium]
MRHPTLAALVILAGCGRSPPGITGTGGGGSGDGATTGLDVGDSTLDGTGPSIPPVTTATTATTIDPGTTSTSTTGDSSTGPLSCADSPDVCTLELSLRRAVDILFVIDNSGSMGGEQGTLAENFATFIDVLEGQQVGANYRIGITTTAGNGSLRATSCRSRLDEFLFTWQFGDIDEQQRGCLDHCELDTIAIPDPWVEKSNGETNLPPGVGMAEALQCVGPQGINGPGLEKHLESMRNALVNDTEGFIRRDAVLAVIFVTDEADCSADPSDAAWLSSDLGMAFWTHPDRASSGVCWTAGVSCTGGPGVYDDCVAVNKDRDGLVTTDEDEMLLYPLSRYIDVLTDIAEQKQQEGGQGEVLVALLGGVPVDYPETGVLTYADSAFQDFNWEYGIGPGCGVGTETFQDPPGIPPVRLREFAEAFATTERNLYSICSDDYGGALSQIADAIGEINERACINGCVVDGDLATPELDPDCSLVETFAGPVPDEPVPPCVLVDDTWDFPAPEVHACFRALTDLDGSTPNVFDDMSAQCLTVGSNVEFIVERRVGVPIAAGTSVDVSCQLAAPVGTTCDEI